MRLDLLRGWVVALAIACASAHAQDDPSQKQFAENWPAMCRMFVSRALTNEVVQSTTKHSPISEPTVCDCAAKRIREDRHLKFLFVGDANNVRSRMKDAGFENYFKGKLTSYSMACVATELERSVDTVLP